VHQQHLTLFVNRKPACPQSSISLLTIIMHNDVWSNGLNSTDFHASSEHNVPRESPFSFWGHHWPACSPDLAAPDYFLWGYIKSKVYETHPANIDDLK
jgi:hypothetical protein